MSFPTPFPTPALTTFYRECVLGRELPGDKVGVLSHSVLPRACGTAVLGLGTWVAGGRPLPRVKQGMCFFLQDA